MLIWIVELPLLLLVIRLFVCACRKRSRHELGQQLLELMTPALQRGMPLPPLLRSMTGGQPRFARRILGSLIERLENGDGLGEA